MERLTGCFYCYVETGGYPSVFFFLISGNDRLNSVLIY